MLRRSARGSIPAEVLPEAVEKVKLLVATQVCNLECSRLAHHRSIPHPSKDHSLPTLAQQRLQVLPEPLIRLGDDVRGADGDSGAAEAG